MIMSKEQIDEYIQVQKKIRGIDLTEEEAKKETLSLMAFVTTVLSALHTSERTNID